MTERNMGTQMREGGCASLGAPLTAVLLLLSSSLGASLLSGCGGASMAGTADESGDAVGAESTAGGDYAAEEDYGAEGGEMMVQPLAPDEQQSVDEYGDEVTQLLTHFDGAMELASPDCGRAGDLRDAICDLAERICGIAADNPEHTDVSDHCDDGQSRCETARNRVGERCPG